MGKAVALLKRCLAANCEGLWSRVLPADAERRAMLAQIVAQVATDVEGRVTQEGTRFATSDALLGAVRRCGGSGAQSAASRLSAFQLYGTWSGLPMVRTLSQVKTLVADLVASGKDPMDALAPMWPYFERVSRAVFGSGGGGDAGSVSAWVIASPNDHESVKRALHEGLIGNLVASRRRDNRITDVANGGTPATLTSTLIVHDRDFLTATAAACPRLCTDGCQVSRVPLPGDSAFVGCVLPTALTYHHELAPAFRLAMQIASQEYLHREIREIGGAYGSAARLGVGDLSGASGVVTFGSYRDPAPERTLELLRRGGVHKWFRDSPPDGRMLREAKLSIFGGIDAPMPPHEVGDRLMASGLDRAAFAAYRRRLLDATLDDVVRSVAEHLTPEATSELMTCCVLGKSSAAK